MERVLGIEEIVEFLVAVFTGADPEKPEANASATARELLEAGLRLARTRSIDDPRLGARLDLAMGRVGVGIGALREARDALERSVAGPLAEPERRLAKLQLALAHSALGDHARGRALLADVEVLCRAAPDPMCLARVHRARGRVQTSADEVDEAIASYRGALVVLESIEPRDARVRSLVAATLFNLGVVMHRGHQYAEAGPFFERAIAIHRKLGGPATLESATAYAMMGTFKNARGEYAEARELLETARELRIKLNGPRHPEVAYIELFLSLVVQQLGEPERALELAESSVSIRRDRLGDDSVDTSFSLARKADALRALGRLDEAKRALIKARSISETALRGSYARQGLLLAEMLAELGSRDDAVAVADEAIAIHVAEYGEGHLMLAPARISYAKTLAALGESKKALAQYRGALELSGPLRPDHPRRPSLLLEIARLQIVLGSDSAARSSLERAGELAAKTRPEKRRLREAIASELDALGASTKAR